MKFKSSISIGKIKGVVYIPLKTEIMDNVSIYTWLSEWITFLHFIYLDLLQTF